MNPATLTARPGDGLVPLDSVLCTEELNHRPSRPPDYETENRALSALAQALADSPHTILQTLADTILEVFQADSAGLSLVTKDGKRFYWPAIAGAWKRHVGGGTPRDFGPCGDVLDCNAPLLFKHFERRYPYLLPATPPAKEALLIPFHVHGRAVGTIWAMAHDDRRRFDAEDLRKLESLGRFAAAAYQAVELQQAKDSRRAALNLMEDAVQASQAAEKLNVELRESEGRYRTFTEQVKDYAIFRTDVQGHAITWNQGVKRILGFDEADFLGQDIVETIFTPEDVRSGVVQHELDTAAAKGSAGNDRWMMRKNGERFYANGVTAALKNDSGELIGFTKVMRDVTERTQAESLIQCQKDSLELLVRGEPIEQVLDFLARSMESRSQGKFLVAIHLMEADGYHFGYVAAPSLPARYAEATKGMDARLELGTCSSAVMSHTPTVVRDFADPLPQTRWPAFTAEVISLGLRGCFSTPILSPDKKVLGTFAIYYREPRDPSPHDRQLVDLVTSTVALAIDRKQAEAALEAAERRLQSIFETVAVSLWEEDFSAVKSAIEGLKAQGITDFARYFEEHPEFVQQAMGLIRVLDVNDATVKMFQAKDKSEFLGSLPKIFVPESMPVFVGELIALAEGRTYFEAEALLNTVRGNPVYVYFTMVLPPECQPCDRVLFSVTDISERKRAEQRIYDLVNELRGGDRRKDEFLAMLAHELRGPLAPLGNMLQIMKRADGNGDLLQQARETMERQVGQLVRLVDDLLDVSRISRNKLELRKERVELASILHQSVEVCRPLAECANHELTVSLPSEPIYLHADPVRLAQVFSNLLNNSCKYTEPGGRIWLTAERTPPHSPPSQGGEAGGVVVSVKDSGIGIPPAMLPRIFDMFTQVDRALERSQGGLGIGLTLVRRLIEMHDGRVEASSEGPGRGSEFVVRLPVLIEKPKAKTLQPSAEPMPATAHRILVVDDNRDSAESLAMLLQITGNETATAHDGLEAVEAAERFRPDVVLLDIGLPKLNGHDACRRIREQPWGKNMVLVALTGWGQEEDRRKSKEAGFDTHMVKPVDYAALTKLLVSLPSEQGGQLTNKD